MNRRLALLSFAVALTLSACGNKGPLVHPPAPPEEAGTPVDAPANPNAAPPIDDGSEQTPQVTAPATTPATGIDATPPTDGSGQTPPVTDPAATPAAPPATGADKPADPDAPVQTLPLEEDDE